MFKKIIDFYKVSEPVACENMSEEESAKKLKRLQWATFLSATIGYGTYYVCRLSLNVIKKPIVDNGVFSETELGIIGSVLFFTYAIGKFTNGFLDVNRSVGYGFGQLDFGLYPFLYTFRRIMGIERLVSVYGCCFLRGRSFQMVY